MTRAYPIKLGTKRKTFSSASFARWRSDSVFPPAAPLAAETSAAVDFEFRVLLGMLAMLCADLEPTRSLFSAERVGFRCAPGAFQ